MPVKLNKLTGVFFEGVGDGDTRLNQSGAPAERTLWRLGPIFKKDENHPFISLFLEMGRRWATRRLGSARRSV